MLHVAHVTLPSTSCEISNDDIDGEVNVIYMNDVLKCLAGDFNAVCSLLSKITYTEY